MSKSYQLSGNSWGLAGEHYERFSEDFSDALIHSVQRLDPQPDETILDVATGTGWTARQIAKRDAAVTAIDYSEALIQAGNVIAQKHDLRINFNVGDAINLPYKDGEFDAVISTFGVIFVSQPELAANEIARVCQKGGRMVLAVWAIDCTIASLGREVISAFGPSTVGTPPPSPFAWGHESRLKQLFDKTFQLSFEHGCSMLRQPNGQAIWDLWSQSHGLTLARLQKLNNSQASDFKQAFIEYHERFRTDVGIAMPRDYLIVMGRRY